MNQPLYHKNNPFHASIKERYSLCHAGSQKDTQHIVLDLKGSGISYQVGDSVAIFPTNHPQVVENTLHALQATGHEEIIDKHETTWKFKDFLSTRANISEISRKLLTEIALKQTNPTKKQFLESLFLEENKASLKAYLATHHLCDVLLANPEVHFSPQELSQLLMPLLPRFYSIASSHHAVGEEVHLTVALLKYTANGLIRTGVCTQYLCYEAPINEPIIPLYVQPHHGFTLPAADAPIIMVGPGTGVAPFRAFMQERQAKNASGKNWLFFGEWHASKNFFYKPFWQELIDQNKLRLDVAFSRDQEQKVYVQHRMLENGYELYKWLEEGAYFFVCGDAQQMAKDVEATLLQIIQQHGGKDEEASKQYLKQLRSEKRYLRDVY